MRITGSYAKGIVAVHESCVVHGQDVAIKPHTADGIIVDI